jgi:signal transduction histidine kinase
MTLLVLLVIGLSSASQTSFLENIYYQYQSSQLISLGNKIVADDRRLQTKVAVVAEMLEGNVMIIGKDKKVLSCQGLGVSTEDMVMDWQHPHHGPLTQQDLDELYAGKIIVNRGISNYFNTEVLSVGIPVPDLRSPVGAVIIHAPLQLMADQLATFKTITIYTAVTGIMLATILSLLFARRVSRPLMDMSRVSLAMASGDFSRQVVVNSNDEVGLLANSLNTLSMQLQEKLNQLQRTDQLRREYVTNVAHEIKTPLTIMQGFTEALEDDLVTSEQERKEYLHNINEEIQRLRRLVNEVLDLKKMEAGHNEFAKDYVDLKSLISTISSKFEAMAVEKGVSLTVNTGKVPRVYCNHDRIQQVFINLINNAFNYTPKGGEIVVTLAPKSDNVMIEVKDTGQGIPPADLPLIWERFYKADKARTRGQGGTGLGLAIVKRIIEAHGGCINVTSKLAVGTTFTIILPVERR